MLRLFSLTALLATAAAYPGGAPDVACSNLTPQHAGATTQDAMASPFQVYVHGDKVAAYIYANNSEPVRSKLIIMSVLYYTSSLLYSVTFI